MVVYFARGDGDMSIEADVAALQTDVKYPHERQVELTTTVNEIGKHVAILVENMHSGPGAMNFKRTKVAQAKKQVPLVTVVLAVQAIIEGLKAILI